MTSASTIRRGRPATDARFRPWEGRLFGGLILAAFVLYGIGSAQADQPVGLVLVMLNSVAVTAAGIIGFRLLSADRPGIGATYVAARIAEAVLLAGGVALTTIGDVSDAQDSGYLLGMLALGVGSVPFCLELGRGQWIPAGLARWGIGGYVALAVGVTLELTTGRAVAVVFAAPGGLFELALGLFLLRRGFGRPAAGDLSSNGSGDQLSWGTIT